MEEKRYPQIDEEQGTGMCSEPIAEPVADYAVSTSNRANGHTEVQIFHGSQIRVQAK